MRTYLIFIVSIGLLSCGSSYKSPKHSIQLIHSPEIRELGIITDIIIDSAYFKMECRDVVDNFEDIGSGVIYGESC